MKNIKNTTHINIPSFNRIWTSRLMLDDVFENYLENNGMGNGIAK